MNYFNIHDKNNAHTLLKVECGCFEIGPVRVFVNYHLARPQLHNLCMIIMYRGQNYLLRTG